MDHSLSRTELETLDNACNAFKATLRRISSLFLNKTLKYNILSTKLTPVEPKEGCKDEIARVN